MTKYIITLLFAFFSAMVLQSCETQNWHPESRFKVIYQNLDKIYPGIIYCDSASFKSAYYVVAYDKGLKIEVVSPNPINIESNEHYNP